MSDNEIKQLFQHMDSYRKSFAKNSVSCVTSIVHECGEPCINSHSISATNLRLICKNNHLSRITMDLFKQDNPIVIEQIGINNASIFRALCNKHDSELFACIDTVDLKFDNKVSDAFFYRALLYELFSKMSTLAVYQSFELESDSDDVAKMKKYFQMGMELAARDLSYTFAKYTKLLASKISLNTRFVCIRFDVNLPFSYLGYVNLNAFPQYSLPPIAEDEYSPCVSIGVVPSSKGSVALLCWEPEAEQSAAIMLKRIEAASGHLVEFFLQVGLEHFENLFFNPDWFHEADDHHETMKDLMSQNITFDYSDPKSRPLSELPFPEYEIRTKKSNSMLGSVWLKRKGVEKLA